jgi:hypothetical protein
MPLAEKIRRIATPVIQYDFLFQKASENEHRSRSQKKVKSGGREMMNRIGLG